MLKPSVRWLAPAALALLLTAAGCSSNPTEVDQDISALESLVAAESDFFTADLLSDNGAEDPDTPSPAKLLAEIVPWRWGRQIQNVDREIDISIHEPAGEPATAEVTWSAEITGVFHVIDSEAQHYGKDFIDNAVRYATFQRRAAVDAAHRGWHMTAISGTEIVSNPNSVEILEVNMTSTNGIDTTFTDVSTLIPREDLLIFAPHDTVTITVTTGNTDDVVMLHYPAWMTTHNTRHHARRMLRNNGDGTYTGTWVTRGMVWWGGQLRNPKRHITIDVLSNGTIFDDTEPYDCNAWGFIYKVRPIP